MTKRSEPYLQAIGTVAAVGAVLLAAFLYLALKFDLPRIPERQVGEETYTSYEAERPDCKPSQLAALVGPARLEKAELCATEQEQYRIEKESLNQAVRATNASEEVLRLTFQQTRIAFVQAVLTVFALSFTGWAAWAAARAARASEKSLSHADELMRNDLRAYVSVSQININWQQGGVEAVLTIANCGRTPATYFTVMGEVEFLPLEAEPSILDDYGTRTTWSALAAGGTTTAPLREKGIFLQDLSKSQDNYLSVRGVIEYGTIFRETCASQFSFMLKYRPNKIQGMQVNTGRLEVFRLLSREAN